MPVYNAGKYLPIALTSIINQTYLHWELIVIDDGSSDGCCNDIVALNDSRIKLIQDGVNKGLGARLNQAIDLANGCYFARMDHDDIAFPQRLARQVAFLQENHEIDLVSSRALTFVGSELHGQLPFRGVHESICAKPWSGFYMPHPTWMGKIEWFRNYRYHVPEVKLAEDQELLLRSYPNSKFASISEPLLAYKLRSGISIKRNLRARTSLLCVQLKFFSKRYQLHNLFFAIITYMSKLALDLLMALELTRHKSMKNVLSTTDLSSWRNLCISVGFKQE